ncbi:Suppressor of Sensor Kinase (SLN1) [Geranomyces variabilis]|nr:Suppressor of Sensor Kinase (SLN1) [Geranomyces variabilis]
MSQDITQPSEDDEYTHLYDENNPNEYRAVRPPFTRSSSISALFAKQSFCFSFGESADGADLKSAIEMHGGSCSTARVLTDDTTHVLVNHATDMTAIIHNLHSSENALMSELIENALVRHTPVVTDTYIWQCIFQKQLLDPTGFEVVRLDEQGQYVIPKDRPNLRRAASEPSNNEAEFSRPTKREARPDIRTASRPSIKRFHTYHATGQIEGQDAEEEDKPLIVPRRPSIAPTPPELVSHVTADSLDSPDVEIPEPQLIPRISVHEPTASNKVYVYASPRPNKPSLKSGVDQTLGAKKAVMFSGSDSGSDNHSGSTLNKPRKVPNAPTHKRSLVIEKGSDVRLDQSDPPLLGIDHSDNSIFTDDTTSKKSSSSNDESGGRMKSAMKSITKPTAETRKRNPPPVPMRPNLDRRVTPLQLTRRNSGPKTPIDDDFRAEASPMNKERAQWQTMLASVLTGEVIRSEKRRITGTLTQKQQLDYQYQIWLGIRAYLRGRSVPEERQRIDERRVDAEAAIDEILKFEVQSELEKSPYEQVVDILAKVDRIEMLYPTRKALVLDKPLYAGLPFQHKVEALNSWMTVSNSLRSQLTVLKNWVGSEDLLISRSQHPLSPDKRIDTTFIERILKETGIARTFEIQIMSFLRGLLAKCKASMIDNALAFKKMQLPTYINELQQLASFPSNLMEEILKVQLETHTEKLAKHSGVMLDQVIEGFGISLSLAIRIKHECQELDTQAEGWSIVNSLSPSYDVILLKSLKCYFTLLNWRLKSTTDTVFFKEAEMLANEWTFMSNICFYIDGGDVETAVQFCELEAELLRKVLVYLEGGIKGVGEPMGDGGTVMGGNNLVRWYARVLDNVRSRARKLLKFQKTLTKEFENCAEYSLSDPFPVLLRNLLHSGYSLVRTDGYANQGLYIFASPSLNNRPDSVAKLLRACFAKYDNFQSSIDNGYILLLSSKDRMRGTAGMTWQGRSMQVRIGKNPRPIDLKPDRVRLVADTSERLVLCKSIFEENINCGVTVVKANRAHVEPVHQALKKAKRTLVHLTEGVIASVKKVREALNRVTAGGGSPAAGGPNPWYAASGVNSVAGSSTSLATSVGGGSPTNANSAETILSAADLIADMFSFASDFSWRALKYVGTGKKNRRMMKRLVGLSVEWVDFCASEVSTMAVATNSMQQKAFKWNLMALEFAMTATSGGMIYMLRENDFVELRKGVARCMRVLIRGFEQGGGTGLAGMGSGNVEEMVGAMLSANRATLKLAVPTPTAAAPSDTQKPNPVTATSNRALLDTPLAKEISALKSASDTDSDHETDEPVPKPAGEASAQADGDSTPKAVPITTVTPASDDPAKTPERSPPTAAASTSTPKAKLGVPGEREQSSPLSNKSQSPSGSKTSIAGSPVPPGPSSRGSGGYHGDTFLQRKQKSWLNAIEQLEEERYSRAQANRLVGKVLDSRNVVDRNLSFLASTSSSISLRWQQGKFLGGGSFGSVYMAINLETADLMAVKEIRFTDVTSLDALQRSIKDEMNVLQLLHHPNIIEYYGVEVHRDKLYIFMEYCPHSVANLLEHGGRFGDEQVTKVYSKQMLRGLEYLHEKGIVHRDVKPANTLLGQEGQIKYVDFGASKIYKTQKTVVVNGEANTLVGTPHYIAPEVITGEGLGRQGAQDIWSMGCCVLEMVTGRKPWAGLDNEWAVMYHIGIANRIPPLPEPSQLSEAGIDFLKQCFTRPASQRPSAKELLEHEWVRDINENDLTLTNQLMEPLKEAAENARARSAAAHGDASQNSSPYGGGNSAVDLSGANSSRNSRGSARSAASSGRGGGFDAFQAAEPSKPVFYPARSPGSENAPTSSPGSTGTETDSSTPGTGRTNSDGYFTNANQLGNSTLNSNSSGSSDTPASPGEDGPQTPGQRISRQLGKHSLRDSAGQVHDNLQLPKAPPKRRAGPQVATASHTASGAAPASTASPVSPTSPLSATDSATTAKAISPRHSPSPYPELPAALSRNASSNSASSHQQQRSPVNRSPIDDADDSSDAVVRAVSKGVTADFPSPAPGSEDEQLAWRGALFRAVHEAGHEHDDAGTEPVSDS